MNIVVCVKQVIDPEAPSSAFQINPATNKVDMKGAPAVIDPYGEYAVEAALKIKDSIGGKITSVTMGYNLLKEVVKKPLSMGADELIILEDPNYDGADSYSTAYVLAMATKKIANYDVILLGREASDTNAGQTGAGIAEILGLPCITLARKIDISDNTARIEKVTADGYEIVEVSLPAVITISNEIGEPRYPTIKGIMTAKRVEPVIWKPADIGLDTSQIGSFGCKTKIVKLFQKVLEGKCEMVQGGTPEEAGINLALKIREAKII
jgi:electron transfer flavoprotein beta subunit